MRFTCSTAVCLSEPWQHIRASFCYVPMTPPGIGESYFGVIVPHRRTYLDGNLLGIFLLNYKLSFSFPSQEMELYIKAVIHQGKLSAHSLGWE